MNLFQVVFCFLLLNIIVPSPPAYGLGAAETIVAIGIVAEGVVQTGTQASSTYEWLINSKHLTSDQINQTQKAIDYLRHKGFKAEADQAQNMLNNSKSFFWKRAGSSFVYKEPGTLKDGSKDRTVAETHGGPVNAVFNTSYIKLQSFFGASSDDGIPITSDEQRARFQAKTLLHELEHLNTQSNTHRVRMFDGARDFERGPMTKHIGNLRELGYTQEEINKVKESYSANSDYKKYVKLIDKELQTKDEGDKGKDGQQKDGPSERKEKTETGKDGDRDGSSRDDSPRDQERGTTERDRDSDPHEGGVDKSGLPPRDGDRFDSPRDQERGRTERDGDSDPQGGIDKPGLPPRDGDRFDSPRDQEQGRTERDRDSDPQGGIDKPGLPPRDGDRFDRPRRDRDGRLTSPRQDGDSRERPFRPGSDRDVIAPFDRHTPSLERDGKVRRPKSPIDTRGEAGHHGTPRFLQKPAEPTAAQIRNAYNKGCSLRKRLVSGSLNSAQVKNLTRAAYGQFRHEKLKQSFRRGYNACGG